LITVPVFIIIFLAPDLSAASFILQNKIVVKKDKADEKHQPLF
jgi:hypothetical protein